MDKFFQNRTISKLTKIKWDFCPLESPGDFTYVAIR